MSYSIIFETKIVKLSDGRYIHFSRHGCNNDDAGRKKNEFTATILDEMSLYRKIQGFQKGSLPYKEAGAWDIKIGSRYASLYDYGEHLLRMLKRAQTYEDFVRSKFFKVGNCVRIELSAPEKKTMTAKEFDEEFYNLLKVNGTINYRRIMEYPDVSDERAIVELIESGKPISIEIRNR